MRLRLEFLSLLMQVDLLRSEGQCLAPAPKVTTPSSPRALPLDAQVASMSFTVRTHGTHQFSWCAPGAAAALSVPAMIAPLM